MIDNHHSSRDTDANIVRRHVRDRTTEELNGMVDAALTRMGTRIYDNPDHPHYGPVRRLWVMLAGLDMLDFAGTWRDAAGYTWDESVSLLIGTEAYSEGAVLRNSLEVLLFHYFEKG